MPRTTLLLVGIWGACLGGCLGPNNPDKKIEFARTEIADYHVQQREILECVRVQEGVAKAIAADKRVSGVQIGIIPSEELRAKPARGRDIYSGVMIITFKTAMDEAKFHSLRRSAFESVGVHLDDEFPHLPFHVGDTWGCSFIWARDRRAQKPERE